MTSDVHIVAACPIISVSLFLLLLINDEGRAVKSFIQSNCSALYYYYCLGHVFAFQFFIGKSFVNTTTTHCTTILASAYYQVCSSKISRTTIENPASRMQECKMRHFTPEKRVFHNQWAYYCLYSCVYLVTST